MKKLILLIGGAAILLIACKKKEGCTNPLATNYDEKAKKDDGTCEFPDDFPDSSIVYFYTENDTLLLQGDTLPNITDCPDENNLSATGYSFPMKLDKDQYDGIHEGETFFSFSNPAGEVFSFYGHLQIVSDADIAFQITEIYQVSPGITESLSTNCLQHSMTAEVALVSIL